MAQDFSEGFGHGALACRQTAPNPSKPDVMQAGTSGPEVSKAAGNEPASPRSIESWSAARSSARRRSLHEGPAEPVGKAAAALRGRPRRSAAAAPVVERESNKEYPNGLERRPDNTVASPEGYGRSAPGAFMNRTFVRFTDSPPPAPARVRILPPPSAPRGRAPSGPHKPAHTLR